jgi:hypothetical protein
MMDTVYTVLGILGYVSMGGLIGGYVHHRYDVGDVVFSTLAGMVWPIVLIWLLFTQFAAKFGMYIATKELETIEKRLEARKRITVQQDQLRFETEQLDYEVLQEVEEALKTKI